MPLNLSETATSIITLLNNINELIVKSSDRKSAEEVMRAIKVYAKGKTYTIPEEKINNFDPNGLASADANIYGLPYTAEEAEVVIAQNGYEPLSEYERKEWRIAIQNAILGKKKDG